LLKFNISNPAIKSRRELAKLGGGKASQGKAEPLERAVGLASDGIE
jgi:hypothetical protein